MFGRLLSLGVAVGLVVALGGAIVVGCYDLPQPDCGFRCGPAQACPDGYSCATDGVCHRIGTPASLACVMVDAAPPDAPPDADIDADVDAADIDAS